MKPIDLSGKRYGRLLILRPDPEKPQYWHCACDCGSIVSVQAYPLKRGDKKSCGCLRRDLWLKARTKHGESRHGGVNSTAEYRVWMNIKTRCLNSRNSNYPYYGGRGIQIHEEWKGSFAAFLRDVGRRPSNKHTLDRINNDDGYYPWNVRWATKSEQRRNQREGPKIEYKGELIFLIDLAKKLGCNYRTLLDRLRRGLRIEDLAKLPAGFKFKTGPSRSRSVAPENEGGIL